MSNQLLRIHAHGRTTYRTHSTIVSTAIPRISSDFHSLELGSWIATVIGNRNIQIYIDVSLITTRVGIHAIVWCTSGENFFFHVTWKGRGGSRKSKESFYSPNYKQLAIARQTKRYFWSKKRLTCISSNIPPWLNSMCCQSEHDHVDCDARTTRLVTRFIRFIHGH